MLSISRVTIYKHSNACCTTGTRSGKMEWSTFDMHNLTGLEIFIWECLLLVLVLDVLPLFLYRSRSSIKGLHTVG